MNLILLLVTILGFMYYFNKNRNKDLSWDVTSENLANCKRVCNGDKCEIKC